MENRIGAFENKGNCHKWYVLPVHVASQQGCSGNFSKILWLALFALGYPEMRQKSSNPSKMLQKGLMCQKQKVGQKTPLWMRHTDPLTRLYKRGRHTHAVQKCRESLLGFMRKVYFCCWKTVGSCTWEGYLNAAIRHHLVKAITEGVIDQYKYFKSLQTV